jgi:hypothetical protein
MAMGASTACSDWTATVGDHLIDQLQDAVIGSPRKVKGECIMETGNKAKAYYDRTYQVASPNAPLFTRDDIIRAFIAGYDRASYDMREMLVDLEQRL